jgi:hypothetical protein
MSNNFVYSGGFRNLFKFGPDGSENTGRFHRWIPCPVDQEKTFSLYAIYSYVLKVLNPPPGFGTIDEVAWISGIAFSKNPNGHTVVPSLSYGWDLNGPTSVDLDTLFGINKSDTDGRDNYVTIPDKKNVSLNVPFVNSGKNKILYIITDNFESNRAITNTTTTVDGTLIENFVSDKYNNTFSRYYNKSNKSIYYGAKIPLTILKNNSSNVLKITFNRNVIQNFTLIEIGTHDY